jgi:TRAP-type C4-dicarboxylate transport system permease small subunit
VVQKPASEIHTMITTEEIARTFDEEVAPITLAGHGPEDWATLVIFWLMCGCVFLQFFTRYVLNNSFAWTEEIAIFCLVGVVFLGSSMCVRMSRHIHVDFLYRYLPPGPARVLATFVDLVRIVLFTYLAVLVWRYSTIISDETMTTIQFPKMPFFMMVFASFVLMALRSVQVMWENIRRGYSVLERPGAFDGSEEEAALEAAQNAAKSAVKGA